jgi:hypothetical protein
VDVYSTDGVLLQRLDGDRALNAPWGVALAPAGFGQFGGDILVSNFGDGTIEAFDPNSGKLVGQLQDAAGDPITIQGLWGLHFGNGNGGGDPNTLYFTAGPQGESHGLFGSLSFVQENEETQEDAEIVKTILNDEAGLRPQLVSLQSNLQALSSTTTLTNSQADLLQALNNELASNTTPTGTTPPETNHGHHTADRLFAELLEIANL